MSTDRRICGVDPGKGGALALIDGDGALLDVVDAPCSDDGPAGRSQINGPALAEIIRRWRPTEAFVERVAAKSTDGTVGAFGFGRSAGIVDGVLAGMGIPVRHPLPVGWRRAVGLQAGATKDASRAEAARRWPAHAHLFARKRDDGRAEACLIAAAGLKVPVSAPRPLPAPAPEIGHYRAPIPSVERGSKPFAVLPAQALPIGRAAMEPHD